MTCHSKNKQRRMPHKVTIATLPNGYAFTVDGQEYMCFTTEQLVSEVFVRLAVEQLEYMNKDMVTAILESAARWQTVKDALMANAELIASARRAHSDEKIAIHAQAKATKRSDEMQMERDKLLSDNVNLRLEVERLKLKLKKFGNMLVGSVKPVKVTDGNKLTKGQREAHKKKKP